jgi:hypothetical protein
MTRCGEPPGTSTICPDQVYTWSPAAQRFAWVWRRWVASTVAGGMPGIEWWNWVSILCRVIDRGGSKGKRRMLMVHSGRRWTSFRVDTSFPPAVLRGIGSDGL